jgi:hypothetical protein
MGPFSPLAREYSRHLKEKTPTGFVILNRKIFIQIYAQIRPIALSERTIRAGWKRAGIYPQNKQRILDIPEIKNFDRTTPEYQPPSVPEGPNSIFSTPKKFEEIRAIISQLEATSTPITRRVIEKLGHAAVQEHSAAQLLQDELKQLREQATITERSKRSKRIEKEQNQRSWNLEQIKKSREGQTSQSEAAGTATRQTAPPPPQDQEARIGNSL